MPSKARSQIISLENIPYYHCIACCVRRAFLCGEDQFTGQNFDHRKQWLIEHFKFLSHVFAIDVCAYAVMSNHYHLVLYINNEKSQQWTELEILELWRERLSSISWYMRCLNETIARMANKEDKIKGRFWEGRFKSQALLDLVNEKNGNYNLTISFIE